MPNYYLHYTVFFPSSQPISYPLDPFSSHRNQMVFLYSGFPFKPSTKPPLLHLTHALLLHFLLLLLLRVIYTKRIRREMFPARIACFSWFSWQPLFLSFSSSSVFPSFTHSRLPYPLTTLTLSPPHSLFPPLSTPSSCGSKISSRLPPRFLSCLSARQRRDTTFTSRVLFVAEQRRGRRWRGSEGGKDAVTVRRR